MTQEQRTRFPNPRESVLDRFAQRYIFDKGVDGKTQYERFIESQPELSSDTKDLLDFVIKKSTNSRLGVLKSVDYKQYEHAFQVLFQELSGQERFSKILDLLSRIYHVILRSAVSNGVENEDLLTIVELYKQDNIPALEIAAAFIQLTPAAVRAIERDMHAYLLLLGHRKYIVAIGKQSRGAQKLQRLLNNASNFQTFNGYHLSQIVVGAGWEEKLKYTLSTADLIRQVIADRKVSALCDLFERQSWREHVRMFLHDK